MTPSDIATIAATNVEMPAGFIAAVMLFLAWHLYRLEQKVLVIDERIKNLVHTVNRFEQLRESRRVQNEKENM